MKAIKDDSLFYTLSEHTTGLFHDFIFKKRAEGVAGWKKFEFLGELPSMIIARNLISEVYVKMCNVFQISYISLTKRCKLFTV